MFRATYLWRLQFAGLLRQADWSLFGCSTDLVAFPGKLLYDNAEIRAEVDREMKGRAKEICQHDVCTLEGQLTEHWEKPATSFRFTKYPLNDTIGTGTITATGVSTLKFDFSCKGSCKKANVLAGWIWEDEAELASYGIKWGVTKQDYAKGEGLPVIAVDLAVLAVEGSAHLVCDTLIGANHHYILTWDEQLESCCEDLE
jgi:hypothetical protein